jgi:hypothetical protein
VVSLPGLEIQLLIIRTRCRPSPMKIAELGSGLGLPHLLKHAPIKHHEVVSPKSMQVLNRIDAKALAGLLMKIGNR